MKITKSSGVPVFVKALLLVLVSAASVTVIMSIQSSRLIHHMTIDKVRDHALLATESAANNAAGALRFNKLDKIEASFDALLAENPDALLGLIAFNGTGGRAVEDGRLSASDNAVLDELVKGVIATGEAQFEASGLMLAVPVLMGADQTLVGIIAGAWTADQYLADVRTDIAETWLTSLVILAVCLTVSAFLMRRWVSRPLGRCHPGNGARL